jgi:hypothetical protein
MKRRTKVKVRKVVRKRSRALAVVKEPPPPVLTGNQALDELLVLARAAADPRCDPAKMAALSDIMTGIRRERREEAFTRDYLKMQRELPEINQDGKIEITPKESARSQKKQVTRFATLANIHRVITPILDAHGFIICHEIDVGAGGVGIIVRSTLKHAQGHQMVSVIPLVLDTTGSKNNNQGAGSSATYGRRYNTIALCNIVSRAMDDADLDGHTAERVVRKAPLEATQNPGPTTTQNPAQTEITVEAVEAEAVATIDMEQAQKLSTAIVDCGVPLHLFKTKYGEPSELPAARLGEAMQACADYKRRMGGEERK